MTTRASSRKTNRDAKAQQSIPGGTSKHVCTAATAFRRLKVLSQRTQPFALFAIAGTDGRDCFAFSLVLLARSISVTRQSFANMNLRDISVGEVK